MKSAIPATCRISAYSDYDQNVERRPMWGDYWLKEHLGRSLRALRINISESDSNIFLHLFGRPTQDLSSSEYKILWHHSHPDWMNPEILSSYEKIYCISRSYTEKIRKMGFDAEWLMIPTNSVPVRSEQIVDIIFVGNARKDGSRRAIQELVGCAYRVRVWGNGWRGLVPEQWLAGNYFNNMELSTLYSKAKIVINDHHEDMRREGFVNPRILDALASGTMVVSDSVVGMEEIFENTVPTFNSREELLGILDKYLNDDKARGALVVRGEKLALRFSFTSAAMRIAAHLKEMGFVNGINCRQ